MSGGVLVLQRAAIMSSQVGDIRVPGRAHEVNSFAACVQAALSHWGRQVSYERVAGLAGVSFCPAWVTGDTCPLSCTERGNDRRLNFLSHALGFTVEASPDPARARGHAVPAFACRARYALRNGAVVLCSTQPCWSVVNRWHDDPAQMTLVAPGSMASQCRVTPDTRLYILRLDDRTLSHCEALREALCFGAVVAMGAYECGDLAYGGRIYDAWVSRLEGDLFCGRCGNNGWACAEGAASRARAGQMAAARFLGWAGRMLPVARENGVGILAQAYARMARRLEPYGRGCGLDELWDDRRRRSRYVDDVRCVRDLHHVTAARLTSLARRL